MNNPKVSIIIPVYNAASLLSKCLDSLANQTYSALELIFIDDCSSDNSLSLLKDFEERVKILGKHYEIHILKHDVNKGVAIARNTGLDVASGEYIYYVDADDYIEYNAIETLVFNTEGCQMDIVGCNWVLQFETKGRMMHQPVIASGQEAIEHMAKGVMRWNLWLFLVKRSLYETHDIRFLPGLNMGEDMMIMFKLFHYAKNVKSIKQALYYYNQSNDMSLTKVYSANHKKEVSQNLKVLEAFFKENSSDENIVEVMNYLKLNIKLPLLISSKVEQYRMWKNWFPEANAFCLSNDKLSPRIQLLQYMASKNQYWFIKLHYFIINKVVYGIIYR